MDIGIVTCSKHFERGTSQEPDDQLLLAALAGEGVRARAVVWDDPGTAWSEYGFSIIRSTWDYPSNRTAFLAWAHEIARQTPLWNAVDIIEWNTHKLYLRDLERRGIPIIPTIWLKAGTKVDLAMTLAQSGWREAVLKPVIGANAQGVYMVTSASIARCQDVLDTLLAHQDVMVQPYFRAVESYGERSLVFIDGILTHAFRKSPFHIHVTGDKEHSNARLEEPVVPTQKEEVVAEEILRQAWQCLDKAGAPDFLFARVDLIPNDMGNPCLIELELVEPRLRLDLSQEALKRLVQSIRNRAPYLIAGGLSPGNMAD